MGNWESYCTIKRNSTSSATANKQECKEAWSVVEQGYKASSPNSIHSGLSKNDPFCVCVSCHLVPLLSFNRKQETHVIWHLWLKTGKGLQGVEGTTSAWWLDKTEKYWKGKRNTYYQIRISQKCLKVTATSQKKACRNYFKWIHIERKGKTLHNKSPEKAMTLNKTRQWAKGETNRQQMCTEQKELRHISLKILEDAAAQVTPTLCWAMLGTSPWLVSFCGVLRLSTLNTDVSLAVCKARQL